MRVFILSIIIAVAVSACGTVGRDATVAASHAAALDQSYETVRVVYLEQRENIPPERRERVDRAWSEIEALRDRVREVGVDTILRDATEAGVVYEMARAAYETLRPEAIALIESGDIDPLTAARLREVDRRAMALDASIDGLGDDTRAVEIMALARDMLPLVRLLVVAL